jgi:DNA helicase-2/ATP-dependent DNA helicase PcrA
MAQWDAIKRLARKQRAELLATLNDASTVILAWSLLEAAAKKTGIEWQFLPPDDPLLDGAEAVLDHDAGAIWLSQAIDPLLQPVYIAHEYAHEWQGQTGSMCYADSVNPEASEEPIPLGVQRVEGYGPEERSEREANIFAREFLLPTPELRRWYLEYGLSPQSIAERLGLPVGVVHHQLARAVLVPELPPEPTDAAESPEIGSVDTAHIVARDYRDIPTSGAGAQHNERSFGLDKSQGAAAHIETGPLLLEAGPGTGKTRTLVGRALYLLEREPLDASVLALTYSNRAAEEMRSRILTIAPEAASRLWIGTIHAFGLELLHKYGDRLGLPPKLQVVDQVRAVSLLEEELGRLDLEHYPSLARLPLYLRDIVRAISRLKDELVGPEDYLQIAQEQLRVADTPEAVKLAQRVLEGARAYVFYQTLLEQQQLVDFGDLISLPIRLLADENDIRDRVHDRFRNVLIDEYQDMNRAGATLVKALASDPSRLWVVGDARQSIYLFRGASSENMRLFTQDYPGAQVLPLAANYRSQGPIVEVLKTLAPRLRAHIGSGVHTWETTREASHGGVHMNIADNLVSERAGIAREITRLRASGVPYREQAVLCRSHTLLARIAARLEASGVPVLYFGNLFERSEVRDLLCLISFACEADGRSLIRIADFPEYQIPLEDVLTLLETAREQDAAFPAALRLAQEVDDISAHGKEAFGLLERHLDGLCYGSTAWSLLIQYLFDRSRYIHNLIADASVAGQQCLLAIFQLLQFLHEQREALPQGDEDPKRAVLNYIRRLEAFGEDKQLRHIPEWASHLDGVRLLTFHASKGMEFSAVFIPALGQKYFPASAQPSQVPLASAVLVGSAGTDGGDANHEGGRTPGVAYDHAEEEENLFFVGLSRARDHLYLSRARSYRGQNSSPSKLLMLIASGLPHPPDGDVTWSRPEADLLVGENTELVEVAAETLDTDNTYSAAMLDTYNKCPLLYYYQFVLKLKGQFKDEGYGQLHHCVYEVLRWLEEESAAGRTVTGEEAQLRLDEVWGTRGPVDHPHDPLYRRFAQTLVSRAAQGESNELHKDPSQGLKWVVDLPHGRVELVPDRIAHLVDPETLEEYTAVQKVRVGRPSESEGDRNIYALYHSAATKAYGDKPHKVQTFYLSTGEPVDAPMTATKLNTRLKRYDDAIQGIQRGDFPPRPDDQLCPGCANFFICPQGARR